MKGGVFSRVVCLVKGHDVENEMISHISEHGYFRPPGRGGKNQKIACLFFSIGRMYMRRRAFERSMLQGYQKIIFVVIALFFTSLGPIKVRKFRKIPIHLRLENKTKKSKLDYFC